MDTMNTTSEKKRVRTLSSSATHNAPKILHQDHGSKTSLDDLEALVTCAIHLGRLKDPRLLPCGHAFCRTCLDKYITSKHLQSNLIECPYCRVECSTKSGNILDLPKACTHNQLVDCIYARQRKHSHRTFAEVLRRFIRDLNNSEESSGPEIVFDDTAIVVEKLESVLQKIELEEVIPSRTSLEIYSSSSDEEDESIEHSSDATQEFQLEDDDSGYDNERDDIKTTMKKYRYYKHSISLQMDPDNTAVHFNMSTPRRLSSGILKKSEYLSENIFLVDSQNTKIVIKKFDNSETKELFLKIGDQFIKPFFVRAFQNALYASGTYTENSNPKGILVCYTTAGDLVKTSKPYDIDETGDFPIGGFCPHLASGDIFLALPGESRVVRLLEDTLMETKKSYYFPDSYSPTFVSHKADSDELWISCPKDQHILITNEASGDYVRFPTRYVDKMPSYILCTIGEPHQRVLFLDSDSQNIFWVIKHGGRIEIQRLLYSGSHIQKMKIKAIVEMSEGRVLLISDDNIAVIKPDKNDATCTLL